MKKFTETMIAIMLVAILTLIGVMGCKNSTTPDLDKVADVTFSYAEGAYNATLLAVELESATPGATIYYSTDGSVPSTVYTDAIQVTAATTIKAVATNDGMNDSLETEASYSFNTPTVIDDFSTDPTSNWFVLPFSGPWTWYNSNQYRALSDGTKVLYLTFYNPGVSDDFTVEMEIDNVLAESTSNERGFNFRDTGGGNAYRFSICPNGTWEIKLFNNGGWVADLVNIADAHIKSGAATNVLRLEVTGSTFKAYVNGFFLGSTNDTTHTSGGIGLIATTGTTAGQDDVRFDNFLVW